MINLNYQGGLFVVKIPCSLTIAGSDPSGGAGIQADLKTFHELQTYGMSVISSITAQNTTGVQDVHHVPVSMIEQQATSIIDDMPIHALKTGMLANVEIMEVVADVVSRMNAPYVMDPVMVAASGDHLISPDSQDYLKNELLALTTMVTPNIPEAEQLTGMPIHSEKDMEKAAITIVKDLGASTALVKGGHLVDEENAVDVFFDGENIALFSSQRVHTKNSHGTGCTLSAAITAYLAKGYSMIPAIELAKKYITQAIRHSLDLGKGSGPTNHWAPRLTHEEVNQK